MTVPWWDDDTGVLDRDRFGEQVEDILQRARRAQLEGHLPHGLLLVGLEGMGRELAAVELAAMLTCPENAGPWCGCNSCRRVRRGIHPDVERVAYDPDLKGTKDVIKADQVRDTIVSKVGARPYEGMARVWILDRVERQWFPPSPANVFLKTLEEPPPAVHFILLAANPGSVLPTIRSRCQTLRLPGAVALAAREGDELPELIASGEGAREFARRVRAALTEAAGGDPLALVVVSRSLPGEPWVYQAAAAAALELATSGTGADGGEGFSRLAARLVEAESRARVLNIRPERLILSCLMQWYEEAVEGAA